MDLVEKLANSILELASLNCEGCQNFYPSFRDHSCYTDSWEYKVCLYLPLVITGFPEVETSDHLIEEVINFGLKYFY